jgi:transposase InsO family protein
VPEPYETTPSDPRRWVRRHHYQEGPDGKIEAFWGVLHQEVLDRQRFRSFDEAEAALAVFVDYYNYHRLSGYDGTPFTDVGFQHIPALGHLQGWLEEVMNAA